MSFANPMFGSRQPRKPMPGGKPRRKKSPLAITLIALAALVVLVLLGAELWTSYLWFSQIGFSSFLVTKWVTQVLLFILGALIIAVPVFLSLRFAYSTRPLYPPVTREQEAIEHFRRSVEPLRKLVTIAAPVILGVFGGLSAARSWQQVLLMINQTPFGTDDPIFGHDIAFYVFTLPVIDVLMSFANFVVLASALGALAGHFIYGGIEWGQERGLAFTKAARIHAGIVAISYMVVLAAQHWFERYAMLTSRHEKFDGAGYTDVNALIPSKTILAISALIVAGLLLAWILKGNWKLPAAGAALIVLSTVTVGMVYPYLVQTFQVDPNERQLEAEFITNNIEATRMAYNVDSVDEISYEARSSAEPGQLREDAATTAQIRLLDPSVVSPTFGQREANRRYWGFEDTLSVDRYNINDTKQDTVIGVRELRPDKLELSTQSWVNQHVIYTHGFGVAAAYGNQRQSNGEPRFFQSGVPGSGELGDFEERVYFGRHSPTYSIVGAPEGAEPQEFDYQSGTQGDDQGRQVSNTYEGNGGPSVGSLLNRFLYAVKFREPNILISNYVNSQSQILYDRDPQQRVHAVAPFLSLDTEMYPAVVDERLVWVIDGYSTSDRYPYSQGLDFDQAVTDSKVNGNQTSQLRARDINYLRNSVKATVDAFDGTVTLYAWDTEEPILKSWQKAFPGAVKPVSEISGQLMSHLRYPADYFKVQRSILGKYHVTDSDEFYVGQDFWQTTPEPTLAASAENQSAPLQSPFYLSMQMPDQASPRFSMSSSYVPESGQDVLTGYLAVDSETGSEAGNPAESYGKLSLLVLPSSNPVSAPRQVQNTFNTNPSVSRELNLLRTGNSEVISGNLLTVPVGGGLLFVQPVYVKSSTAGGGTSYPLLRKVLVSFGDKVGYADTLDGALNSVFGGDSGADAGDATVPESGEATAIEGAITPGSSNPAEPAPEQSPGAASSDTPSPSATPSPSGTPSPSDAPAPSAPAGTGDPKQDLDQALKDLVQASKDSDAALKAGDWAKYGEAQQRMDDAIARAEAANAKLNGG